MNRSRRDETSPDAGSLLEERPSIRAAEPRPDWRRGYIGSWSLIVVLGIWLALSPFVLDIDGGWWLPVVIGALLAVIGAVALAQIVPSGAASLVAAGLGVLLFVGGLLTADSSEATWNAAAGGALAAFLAVMAAAAGSQAE